MKHFITFLTAIILMVVASYTAQAQSNIHPIGSWFTVKIDSDELLEQSNDTVFSFLTEDGDKLFHYDSHPNAFIVSIEDGIFDFKTSRYSTTYTETIIVGYYNNDGELIDKEETYLFKLGNGFSNGYFGSTKMYKYMTTNNGYVRIVARKYRGNSFDAKIPTWVTNPPQA